MKSMEVPVLMKPEAYASEFIGTYFLVLTIGLNVLQRIALAPISVGFILMAMIFATGKVSGGHFNPAVTLGVMVCRQGLLWRDALLYVLAQLAGAVAAGLTYTAMLGATFSLRPGQGYDMLDALAAEALFTVALVFVVLSVATVGGDNQNFGLSIGFTVTAAAFSVGRISGSSLNPAVAFGVICSHWLHVGGGLEQLAPYILGPLLGAIIAAALFRIVRAAHFVDIAEQVEAERLLKEQKGSYSQKVPSLPGSPSSRSSLRAHTNP